MVKSNLINEDSLDELGYSSSLYLDCDDNRKA